MCKQQRGLLQPCIIKHNVGPIYTHTYVQGIIVITIIIIIIKYLNILKNLKLFWPLIKS
jgi:hypothetical protein